MGYIGNGPYQGVLTGGNIQDGTVETTDLADGAITTVKINDGAVTAGKLAAGAAVPTQTGQSGKYLTTDGSTASWGTVDLSTKVSKTGDTMTGNLLLPGLGVDTDSDSHVIRMSANASQSSAGVAILQWGKDMSTWGGDIHYLTDSRGVSGQHRFWKWDGTNFVQTMSIDSSGNVTKPYSVAFYALNSGAGSENGDGYTTTPGKFPNAVLNRGNGFSTSTNRFTAPVTGLYMFASCPGYKQTGVDFAVRLMKNGTDITDLVRLIGGNNSHSGVSGSCMIYLAANDYVELNMQASGSNVYHRNNSSVPNWFAGYLVG